MSNQFDGIVFSDENLRAVFEGTALLIGDGAMGTALQAQGLVKGGELADLLCLANPEAITAVHRSFVEAGAELITSNTFNSNARHLKDVASVEEVYAAAVACARAAGARYVAGDIGPSGDMLAPLGTLSEQEALELFGQQARAAAAAGADLIMLETFTDVAEAEIAVKAVRANCNLPIIASMAYNAGTRTMFGNTPAQQVEVLGAAGAQVVGVNCSQGPAEMAPVVAELLAAANGPVSVRPNAGVPHMEGSEAVFDVTPQEFEEHMRAFVADGVTIVGGCCGTTPAFVEKLVGIVAAAR